jgi:hypothetical protein
VKTSLKRASEHWGPADARSSADPDASKRRTPERWPTKIYQVDGYSILVYSYNLLTKAYIPHVPPGD